MTEAFEYLLSGKMWDYSLSWGMEAHERFQLQCSDWVNCFWHLNGCWWFTVISPPRSQLVTSCLVARCSGGEVIGFGDRL